MRLISYAFLCRLVLALTVPTASAQGTRFTIIANPGSFPDIERASAGEGQVNWRDKDFRDDDACTESFAATELRRFLAVCIKVDQAEIRLEAVTKLPREGHVFVVGNRRSNPLIATVSAPGGKGVEVSAPESFCISAFRQDSRIITTIEGYDRVGTLYGTYTYLRLLGMRFYGLGEPGTVYPKDTVVLPSDVSVVQRPDYVTRGFWPWLVKADEDFYLWMARNRLNLWTPEDGKVPLMRKLGLRFIQGGHIIQHACLNPQTEYPYKHIHFGGGDNRPNDPYPVSHEYKGDANKDGKLSYFEAHPEWYGLQKGKRSDRITTDFGDNYCTSNGDATRELAKNLIRELAEGQWREADVLNVWMLDNGTYCECDACKKQGTCTDRLFSVVYALRKETRQAEADGRLQRTVKMSAEAYHETLPPPSKSLPADFDYQNCFIALYPIERTYTYAFADPRSTKINQPLLKRYLEWTSGDARTYKGDMLIGEYYNVSSFASLPLVFTRIMAADIPWYYNHGTRHFNYMHTPLRLWGTWTLHQHLMAELLWDVKADARAIVEEYFARYYPTTSRLAKAFYEDLEAMSSNMKAFKHYTLGYSLRNQLRAAAGNKKVDLFPREDLQYFPKHQETDSGPAVVEIVAAVRRARQAIDDALLTCTDAQERGRLIEDEHRFAYGEAMILFYYHTIRTILFHQRGEAALARHEFRYLEPFARKLASITDLTNSAGEHANFKNGLVASQIENVYDFLKAKYSSPASAGAATAP